MTTFNVLVLNCAIYDAEVVNEAVSVLRWAADAGPIELGLRHAALASDGPLSSGQREALGQADAVLLANWTPSAAPRVREVHEALGVYATVEHPSVAAGHEAVVVRAPSGAVPARLRRAVEQAFMVAERRNRSVAYAASPVPARRRLWAQIVAEVGAGFPRTTVESHDPSQLLRTEGRDPVEADVVVTDLPSRGPGPGGGGPVAWLGTGGAVYAPAERAVDGVEAKLVAAMRSAAMLLEYSAARYGLAESIRHAVAEVLHGTGTAPAGELGQAVLDTLEATFEPCAGW